MTNEELKIEAIKKAYSDKWDLVKDFIIEHDGSVETFPFLMDEGHENDTFYWKQLGYKYEDINHYLGGDCEPSRWRPTILDDIEDNNGWVRIEPDGSNLPNGSKHLVVLDKDGDIFESIFNEDYLLKKCTHYRLPIEFKKPIY